MPEPGGATVRVDWVAGLDADDHAIHALYDEAFPPSEQTPWPTLVEQVRSGRRSLGRILRSDSGDLLGFVLTARLALGEPRTTLIEYFAISSGDRGQGVGRSVLSTILGDLRRQNVQVVVLEAESPLDDTAKDDEIALRRRRIAFYERCGAVVRGIPPFHEVPDLSQPGATVRMALLAFPLDADVPIPWSRVLSLVIATSYPSAMQDNDSPRP